MRDVDDYHTRQWLRGFDCGLAMLADFARGQERDCRPADVMRWRAIARKIEALRGPQVERAVRHLFNAKDNDT